MMSPDERARAGTEDEEFESGTQPTGKPGLDTVSTDLTYDEDRGVFDVGADAVGTSTDTSTNAPSAPVDMQTGYSQAGTTMADRVAGGSIDAAGEGPYGDESMFDTDSDGTPSADDQIGAMSRDDSGGGILSTDD